MGSDIIHRSKVIIPLISADQIKFKNVVLRVVSLVTSSARARRRGTTLVQLVEEKQTHCLDWIPMRRAKLSLRASRPDVRSRLLKWSIRLKAIVRTRLQMQTPSQRIRSIWRWSRPTSQVTSCARQPWPAKSVRQASLSFVIQARQKYVATDKLLPG